MRSEIFTFEKLYKAYLACRRTKRQTINALKFERDLERNLFSLQRQLEQKTYKPGRSICFAVITPSPREIFAASFKDRVVHHVLVNEIIEIGERSFIFDSFACRKNKGTHKCVERLKGFIPEVTNNYKNEAHYLQLDISGFFMNINHDILYSILEKMILRQNKSEQWKKDVLWLASTIIYHKPTENFATKGNLSLFDLIPTRKSLFYSAKDKGLPIGNYSSQFFANLYLNELDQYVKRELKCKYYVRYVDDLILLSQNREQLKLWGVKIGRFLCDNLDMNLNLSKTKIQPLNNGIDFLGYFTKPKYTLVRRKVVGRLKEKLFRNDKSLDTKKGLATINSYFGHFVHCDSYNLRKDIYENQLGKLKEKFVPKKGYSSLEIARLGEVLIE